MVIYYCENGNLRKYLNQSGTKNYESKIENLVNIASGLLDIHNAGKVHKDFHSGNLLFDGDKVFISDLEMCQPANIKEQSVKKGNYGVLQYLIWHQKFYVEINIHKQQIFTHLE